MSVSTQHKPRLKWKGCIRGNLALKAATSLRQSVAPIPQGPMKGCYYCEYQHRSVSGRATPLYVGLALAEAEQVYAEAERKLLAGELR